MTQEQKTAESVSDGQIKTTFDGLGISQGMIEVLNKLHFTTPTPIQAKTIPVAIQGKDVLGIAQTGTGKTLAFGVPMVEKLMTSESIGLVLVPTRELAQQVYETISRITAAKHLATVLLMGGASMHLQIQALRKHPKIIIATPGRLNDHIRQRNVRLDKVGVFVLDEADRMLDMGFAPQIREIAQHVPHTRQTMLFSATMPTELTRLAHSFMKDPQRIEVAPQGSAAALVSQEVFYVSRGQKPALLLNLLAKHKGSVLVFSRTKFGAKHITQALRNNNISSEEIHSNRTMGQRKSALEGFKRGTYRVLVATDIAARGLHVNGIEVVINYDLPEASADYVHRIGRTGRAGKTGHAISFATFDQRREVADIERLMKKKLIVSPLPELPVLVPLPARSFAAGDQHRAARKPFGKPSGGSYGRKPFGKPSGASHGSKPFGNPSTGAGHRSTGSGYGSKPSGSYGSKPSGSYGSKPSGSYGSKPSGSYDSKPSGGYGSKSSGSHGKKPFGSSNRRQFNRPFKKAGTSADSRPDYYAPR